MAECKIIGIVDRLYTHTQDARCRQSKILFR